MKFLIGCVLLLNAVSGLQWDFLFPQWDIFDPLTTTTTTTTTPGTPVQSCDCGWVNRGRIVGGKETGQNEYPPMVALEVARTRQQFCGGTILTPWHILTAAHCTEGKSPQDIIVNVGAHNLRAGGSTLHRLSSIAQHRGYEHNTVLNDIAIVIVSSPISFNRNVGPACMPRQRMDLVGHLVRALGWGHTTNQGTSSNVLREVDLRVISMRECRRLWRTTGQKGTELPQSTMNVCTNDQTKDTCQGDSGGPLIWQNPRTNRYTIVALVSYGSDCGGYLPGVNTDVGAYLDWINGVVESTKPGVKTCSPA